MNSDLERQSEEQLWLTLEAAHMGTWDWDMRTGRITWSRGHESLFGLAPGSFRGTYQDFIERIHPDDRESINRDAARAIEEKVPVSNEYRVIWPDGSVHWVAARGQCFHDEAGTPLRMRGVVLDITERKRAEETLQALYRASLAIQEPLGLQERLDGLLKMAREVLHLDRLSILLADPECRWLEGAATLGTKEPAEALRVPIGPEGGGVAQAFLSQQPVIWGDSHAPVPEQIRLQPPYNQLETFRSRAFVLLPLVVQGRAIGVMMADRNQTQRPLKPAQLRLLQFFAGQTAIAIENSRLFEQIQAGQQRLVALSSRLVELQETERRHIARELHDEIGQALTGLKLSLEMGARSCRVEVKPCLGGALALVNELMGLVRDMSLDLRPAMLDDLGLLPALLWHFDRYTAQTGVRVTFKHTGLDRRFAPEIETAAYRIVQEALTNAARHAGVSQLMVQLWAAQDKLEARIEDHGAGFDLGAALTSGTTSGLAGMRERAVLLGGQLSVESAPGIGTRLTAELPLGAPVERRKQA